MYSWEVVGRSFALSGMGVFLFPIIACLNHHPSCCRAMTDIQEVGIRSFGLKPPSFLL